MAALLDRLSIGWKALRQLGPQQVGLNALYRFGLWTGHYRRLTQLNPEPGSPSRPSSKLAGLFQPEATRLADLLGGSGQTCLLEEAGEVINGQARLFGGPPVLLNLAATGWTGHWTEYAGSQEWTGGRDVKLIWEPGRLGWVYPLARAYRLTGDERYPLKFWELIETFWEANPANRGPHWSSAQEVAIRLMGLVFAGDVFAGASGSTPQRLITLLEQVAAHARRIPSTLVYARSQNNNHLLSEAVGLYTAGLVLQGSEAETWRKLGWKWLIWCLENQIHADGTYVQHSSNYHRLMLQLALWANLAAGRIGDTFSPLAQDRLRSAVRWFAGQVDPWSGEMSNLGANDGAYLFPLAAGSFRDARPVLQAAARHFLGKPVFPPGPWDEMSLWFPEAAQAAEDEPPVEKIDPGLFAVPGRLSHPTLASWAHLRAVHFLERPSHADQLHLDLWWRGVNLCLDPGTFLYNGEPPWDNRFSGTGAHNPVVVDGQDQMRRAGRFLWLDWAQAELISNSGDMAGSQIAAVQHGYERMGIRQRRVVVAGEEPTWRIFDHLSGAGRQPGPHHFRLNLLLPDWEWKVDNLQLRLRSPEGWIRWGFMVNNSLQSSLTIHRGGEVLYGPGRANPQAGWYSPTYTIKIPALSIILEWEANLPTEAATDLSLELKDEDPENLNQAG